MIPIIEREGRYFLQLTDGELERTPEQLRQFTERQKAISSQLEGLLTAHKLLFRKGPHRKGSPPPNRWDYAAIQAQSQEAKVCFQEHFNAGEGMEPCYSMCDIAISSLKKILALPGADTDLTNFHIAAWEDIRAFLSLFPAQRLQLTAPAIVAGGSHMAAPDTSQQIPLPAAPFAPLLLNYTESELTGLLTKLGLVGVDGQATPAASPGAWVGVFYALLEAEPSRITDNKAGASRAFRAVFGAEVSGRAIQNGLGKQKSEAERMKDRALKLLNG